MVEFAALVIGGMCSVIGFFCLNKQAKRRHNELLDKMETMIGQSPDEQRRIVQDAREQIGLKEEWSSVLTKEDGTVERYGSEKTEP